ncbi:unnamed protein product [Didymodactylos carnosus]|uniref:Splicing factor Cactin n=1 Tax=Didymodactylos carnosus TaxID=1234261 RepID=A0A814FRT2_9BILA|nr:unnamed protein product [Didymodactylos carnosus]CAF3758854.1 unnamed protein product [Didymodactylos carnosus]
MVKYSKEKHKKKHHHHRHRDKKDSGHRSKSRSSRESRSSSQSTDQDEYCEKSRERISTGEKTMAQIENEREKLRLEKKKQRALVKTIETPQEKRLRRLAKKTEKERRRKSELGWGEEHMDMNNTNNPFGDDKLLENFVWVKKLERQGYTNLPVAQLNNITKQRVEENKSELEKLKRQRLERERQKEEMDKEKEFLQRLKEADYYREWEKQEDSFHFNQVKLRSNIRIFDGRAKPIDLLARYISEEDDKDLSVEIHEPSTYLNGLSIRDLEDLLADIRVYTELEIQSQRQYDKQYWFDITLITEDELQKLKKLQNNLLNDVGDRREGINQAVVTDVNETFKNKTHQQLEQLEERIKSKIEKEKEIDIGYWESLLVQLQAHMARARLKDRHQFNLRKKLRQIKDEQGIFAVPQQPSSSPLFPSTVVVQLKKEKDTNGNDDDDDNEEEQVETEQSQDNNEEETKCIKDYESGRYSPQLLTQADLNLEQYIDDELVDKDKLERQRQEVRKTGSIKPDVEDAFEKFARDMGSLTVDDTSINGVVPLDIQYLWSDKYRPRKPRFFNKVHTGYDWNQYNKKHYDTDNPPPKTVQGYKFNIFYPDLIDKTKTPSYNLTICEDNRDFGILKFHAGPPYEDIAFKIVSKEWDYSYKHGFRCQFQNGMFQLWFHFRKWKYRR